MIKSFFQRNKVWFLTFASFLLYNCIFHVQGIIKNVNDVVYEFHMADFSVGFCSKLLPGAVYNFLVHRYDGLSLAIYLRVITVIFIFLTAFFVQKFYNAVKSESGNNGNIILFLVLFLTGPLTFAYNLKTEGAMDNYWMLFFIASLLCLQNRVLRWLVPTFCALMIFTHFGAVLCFVPLLGLVILLKITACDASRDKKSLTIIFILCVVFSVVTLFYFALFEKQNILLSENELIALLNERGAAETHYFTWNFYETTLEGYHIPESLLRFDNAGPLGHFIQIVGAIIYYNLRDTDYLAFWPEYLFMIPVIVMLYEVLHSYRKQAENKGRKFIALCLSALPAFTIVSSFLVSNDTARWVSNAILCLFTGVMALIYYDYREQGAALTGRFFSKFRMWEIAAYIGVYALALSAG